jgi:3-oxoacyl-[acyl-carrier-protein] synthase II
VGAVRNFVAEEHIDRKLAHRTDRMTHFAFAAIEEAIRDAGLRMEEENPRRVGAVIANVMGGVDYVLKQLHTLYTRGPRLVSAYTAIAWLQVASVGQTSIRYGIQGYCKTPVNDTISGLDAMAMACGAIRRGAADVILSGGCEAFLHPIVLSVLAHRGECVMGDDPRAYRPFDRRAAGVIIAEGAGMCVLEDYDHARRRGAPIYGEIVGYGQTNDAHALAAPSADGKYYARAIRLALHEGGVRDEEIAYFSLDGHAIPTSDQGEADALLRAFGSASEHIPLSVPRTIIGHSYAAAGAIDTITALLALKHSLVPPTLNCEEMEPRYNRLNLVRDEPRAMHAASARLQPVVVLGGRGIGGANLALALRKI